MRQMLALLKGKLKRGESEGTLEEDHVMEN
jgi:hypothetical protein